MLFFSELASLIPVRTPKLVCSRFFSIDNEEWLELELEALSADKYELGALSLSHERIVAVLRDLARLHTWRPQTDAEKQIFGKVQSVEDRFNAIVPLLAPVTFEGIARVCTQLSQNERDRLLKMINHLASDRSLLSANLLNFLDAKCGGVEQRSLLHGDVRSANLFFNLDLETDDRPELPLNEAKPVVFIDWQAMCRGHAAVDLVYFLANSQDISQRRQRLDEQLEVYINAANVQNKDEFKSAFAAAACWPLIWTALTINSANVDDLLPEAGKDSTVAEKDAAHDFVLVGANRYAALALDSNLNDLIEF